MIERRKQEAEKKKKEAEDAEVKELEDKAEEAEKKVEELAARMIVFLIEDNGWAVDLDRLHSYDFKEAGGRVQSEIAEIQREISPLIEKLDAIQSAKREKEKGWLKFGVEKMKKQMWNLGEKLKALHAQQDELGQRAYRKREEFIKIEKENRGMIFNLDHYLRQLEWKTGKKSKRAKIKLSEDFLNGLGSMPGSGNRLANYGIYKPFLKQFGFDVDHPVAEKS